VAAGLCSSAYAKEKRELTVVKDADYGEVLFHFYQEDYFPAIVRLLAAQEQLRLPNHEADAELLSPGCQVSATSTSSNNPSRTI
jgi:hypothetical protein